MKTPTKRATTKNNQNTKICYKSQKQRFIIAFCIDKALFLWFSACHCEKQRMLRRGNQGEAAFRYAGFPRSLRSLRNDKRVGTPAPDVIAFFLLSFRATSRNLGASRTSLRRISTTMPTHRGLWLSPFAKAVATLVSAFVTHCKQVDSLGMDGMTYGKAVLLFC